MAYTKPTVVAQNSKAGSFAAGCPTAKHLPGSGSCSSCSSCEISN
ncbi:MAG: hypothetical protein SOZ24_01550 [Treponema sp.]|nr:hypothetical protein [Treponema sp.]